MANLNSSVALPNARVLIVEDDEQLRRRYVETLAQESDMTVVGVAGTRRDAASLIDKLQFNVLVIDLGLPDGNGIELIARAVERFPKLDVMVVTEYSDESHVVSAIEAGATGYILKEASLPDLPSCIRLLQGGGSPVSPVVARSVLRAIRSRTSSVDLNRRKRAPILDVSPLSQRETEILQLLAKGIAIAEIGDILSISAHTVTAHIKKIYRKLQVHSRGEAVYEANILGLLPTRTENINEAPDLASPQNTTINGNGYQSRFSLARTDID